MGNQKGVVLKPDGRPPLGPSLLVSCFIIMCLAPVVLLSGHIFFRTAADLWLLNIVFALTPVVESRSRLITKIFWISILGAFIMFLSATAYALHQYKEQPVSDSWLVTYSLYVIAVYLIAHFLRKQFIK